MPTNVDLTVCPYWEDGKHCFETSWSLMGTVLPLKLDDGTRIKECTCGLKVKAGNNKPSEESV